jgi:hypothetical protein
MDEYISKQKVIDYLNGYLHSLGEAGADNLFDQGQRRALINSIQDISVVKSADICKNCGARMGVKKMRITKDDLIEEITEQLKALGTITDLSPSLKLPETLAMLDLQFRLKCKLYELTNEEENNEY